jgi:hypothetical protein
MAQNTRPGRVGVDYAPGRTIIVGLWETKWDAATPTEWLGQLRTEFTNAMSIAQKYHDRLEATKLAKIRREAIPTVEPAVTERRAREDLKALAVIFNRVNAVEDQAFLKKATLRPFPPASNLIEAHRLTETRALLLKMPIADRMKVADKKSHFQRAILDAEPELSGISEPFHKQLHERLVREFFPAEIDAAEQALEACALDKRAIAAGVAAAEHEIVASGATVIEPPAPAPAKAWA